MARKMTKEAQVLNSRMMIILALVLSGVAMTNKVPK